jgi:hypothetical protein
MYRDNTLTVSHYDHLDPEAVKELGDSCEWVVPKGAGNFLRELGVTRVTELDWWEETTHKLSRAGTEQDYTITAVPVRNWSARSPKDTNATLWAAFHVKSHGPNSKSFIHLGDTGYSPTLYEAVGRVLGPVDLAAIPIGSYEPRWHMHLQHTDPEGAVRMALNLGAKRSVGVHWGTWIMSDEKCESRIKSQASYCVLWVQPCKARLTRRQPAPHRPRQGPHQARRFGGGVPRPPRRPDHGRRGRVNQTTPPNHTDITSILSHHMARA